MRGRTIAVVLAALSAGSLASSGRARAADDACFTAAVDGQKAERAGKLLDARARFVACGQRSCDPAVIDKCQGWLAAVEKKLPSVTLALRDAQGRDLTATRATIDGTDASNALEGRAIDVDPGPHRIAAWVAGREHVETVIVREGEKLRVVVLHPPADGGAPVAPVAPAAGPSHAMLYGSIVAGGFAVAAGGVFAVFSAKGLSDRAKFGCASGCPASDYTTVHNEFLAADVALGVAVGSLAIATTLFLLRPKSPPPQAALVSGTPLRFTF
jgi:hypothetical protein